MQVILDGWKATPILQSPLQFMQANHLSWQGLFEFCKIYQDFEPRLMSLQNQEVEGVANLSVEEVLSLNRLEA